MVVQPRLIDVPSTTRPTARQLEVLATVATYGTYRYAGEVLDITERTVRNHLHALYQKLGVRQLGPALIALGWLHFPAEDPE